jgi:hypothetical protein
VPRRRAHSRLLPILLVAALLRLLLLADNLASSPGFLVQDLEEVRAAISDPGRPYMNSFGFEASNIAYALVCAGEGYASPFGGATGPTAWIAPGVVSLYAAAFAFGGCFTTESILFAFALALMVSLATIVVVYCIGRRVGGTAASGLLAALAFALLPFEAWIFHVNGHLDFNLQVACFAVLLLAVLRAGDAPRSRRFLELGLVSSVAALFNPGFLLGTAVALPFLVHRLPAPEIARLVAIVLAVHIVVVGPYVGWQSRRLGGFVPVKSNGAFELALGNTAGGNGPLGDAVFAAAHPSQNAAEFLRYRELGEIAYVRRALATFTRNFRAAEFVRTTARRAHQFFLGYELKPWDRSKLAVAVKTALWKLPALALLMLLVLRRGRLTRLEVLMLLFTLAYAVPYLLTGVMERYRLPMVTTVAVLLALAAVEISRRARRRFAG